MLNLSKMTTLGLSHRKNYGSPLDIFGYLKNTHKNPKFGRVRQVPIWELGWEFPGWDVSHFAKFGIFIGILQIPKNIQKWESVIFSCVCAESCMQRVIQN